MLSGIKLCIVDKDAFLAPIVLYVADAVELVAFKHLKGTYQVVYAFGNVNVFTVLLPPVV